MNSLKSGCSVGDANIDFIFVGLQVRVKHSQARVNWGGVEGTNTTWHHHMASIPSPVPPFFSYPNRLDCLIYLDACGGAESANGGIALVPRSHRRPFVPVDQADTGPQAGQVELELPAGSVVLMHRHLAHRALPSRADASGKRRMMIIQYGTVETRRSPKGRNSKPPSEKDLVKRLLAEHPDDAELHELLGKGGYQ
eukprot:SAG11_NODE_7234_length_1174_cov_1.808372_2_plen_196_part_00